MIDWGLYLTTAQPDGVSESEVLQNSLRFCDLAERLHYHSIWLLEHHFTRYGLCGSPIVFAANILGRTQRIKVGTAVSVLPLEHPVRIAESVALIDHLSRGRFMYGVGRGFFLKDFETFSVDVHRNHEILEQWTEVLLAAWTKPTVSHHSDLLSLEPVEVLPKPLTYPHPPLYVACSSPTRTQWAARKGFPMMMDYLNSDAEKRSQVELYCEVASEHGHDPAKISHMLSCVGFVGERVALEDRVKDTMIWWENEFLRASHLFEPEFRDVRSYEFYHRQRETAKLAGRWLPEHRAEQLLDLNPNGSPAECIDRLNDTIEGCNIGLVVMGFEALRDAALIEESMTRFAEEVAPHVQSSAVV